MKKLAVFLALALASVALVACGGDDDNGTTTTETGGAASNGAANGGEGGGGGSEITIEAASSGLAFASDSITAKAGEATLAFENPQPIGHDADIEDESGKVIADTEVITEGSDSATIKDLEPGKYAFFCSVPGHREAGMEGTLTVE